MFYATHSYDVMLTKLVRVCPAVISLTVFSHRIFKHETIVTWSISRENTRQCSIFSAAVRILFTFLLSSQFYRYIRLKSTTYFLDPSCTCTCSRPVKKLSRVIGRLTQWKSDFLWSSLLKSKGRVGYRSWSRFFAVSLQVTRVINPAVGCLHFSPGPQSPSQALRGLLPISLLGERWHDGCEQFA